MNTKKTEFSVRPEFIINEGKTALINANIEEVERPMAEMGATVPDASATGNTVTVWLADSVRVSQPLDYAAIVSAFIRSRYSADEETAIINNHLTAPNDAHKADFAEYQQWRSEAKKIAKQVLGIEVTPEEILAEKSAAIDAETDKKILSGHVWNDTPVWLSSENQFNYKAAYDIAVQTDGANLPITFKLGEKDGSAVYHTFETVLDIQGFYLSCVAWINQCLNEGWQKKEALKAE